MTYRFVDHTGDIAVELVAESERTLFAEAVRALCAILVDCEESSLETHTEHWVSLDAEDGESLLVDFLNELVFLFDSRRFLPMELHVHELCVDGVARLRATVFGDRFDADRHRFLTEIKAATFHDLKIDRSSAGLKTTVVFDL